MPVLSPVLIGNTESWQAGMPVLPAETAVGVQKFVETKWKSRLAGSAYGTTGPAKSSEMIQI